MISLDTITPSNPASATVSGNDAALQNSKPKLHGPSDYKVGPRGYIFKNAPLYKLVYIFNFPPTGLDVLNDEEIERIIECALVFIQAVSLFLMFPCFFRITIPPELTFIIFIKMLEEVFFTRGLEDGVYRFTRRVALLYDSDSEEPESQKLFKLRKLEALFELTSVITKQFSSSSDVSFCFET